MWTKNLLHGFLVASYLISSIQPAQAQARVRTDTFLALPNPGTMVSLSPAYKPTMMKGIKINPKDPFAFDCIVDRGDDALEGNALRIEGEKLIRYFMASLAVPEEDLWVNLSPYEKNRTVPTALGKTDMGRDLLAQDYLLKQLTASLIYPEKDLGKKFWDRVYAQVQVKYGRDVNIPLNTFNKVWIMADNAEIFEKSQTALVTKSHLKVMLEEDYLALSKSSRGLIHQTHRSENEPRADINKILRDIILPQIEQEVNQGKNFAKLRQIFNAIILATWYKKNLKHALMNEVYANKNQVKGIALPDPLIGQKIYAQYLQAYKRGVFNYVKEETVQGQVIPRKYFSGGVVGKISSLAINTELSKTDHAEISKSHLVDFAMTLSVPLRKSMLQFSSNNWSGSQQLPLLSDAGEEVGRMMITKRNAQANDIGIIIQDTRGEPNIVSARFELKEDELSQPWSYFLRKLQLKIGGDSAMAQVSNDQAMLGGLVFTAYVGGFSLFGLLKKLYHPPFKMYFSRTASFEGRLLSALKKLTAMSLILHNSPGAIIKKFNNEDNSVTLRFPFISSELVFYFNDKREMMRVVLGMENQKEIEANVKIHYEDYFGTAKSLSEPLRAVQWIRAAIVLELLQYNQGSYAPLEELSTGEIMQVLSIDNSYDLSIRERISMFLLMMGRVNPTVLKLNEILPTISIFGHYLSEIEQQVMIDLIKQLSSRAIEYFHINKEYPDSNKDPCFFIGYYAKGMSLPELRVMANIANKLDMDVKAKVKDRFVPTSIHTGEGIAGQPQVYVYFVPKSALTDQQMFDRYAQFFISLQAEYARHLQFSAAMMATAPGGIDLNTRDMATSVVKEGDGVKMNVDPVLLKQIKREGVEGLVPVVLRITPIENIFSFI